MCPPDGTPFHDIDVPTMEMSFTRSRAGYYYPHCLICVSQLLAHLRGKQREFEEQGLCPFQAKQPQHTPLSNKA